MPGGDLAENCAQKLNVGLTLNKSIKKVRLSFCLYKIEILKIILPGLCDNKNLEEIDLSANNMNDEYRYQINKLIQSHQESKDELIWQYGLRNETPPIDDMKSLKRLILSHNNLTVKTIHQISRSIKNDIHLRELNLRANDLDEEAVTELNETLKENWVLFNLDLR